MNKRTELLKKMQDRLASPDVGAKLAERRAIVEARNQRLAEKEEIRRQEEARLAVLRAEEEAKLEAEREVERQRLEVLRLAEEKRLEEERAAYAASATARASRALAELADAKAKRDAKYAARKARNA